MMRRFLGGVLAVLLVVTAAGCSSPSNTATSEPPMPIGAVTAGAQLLDNTLKCGQLFQLKNVRYQLVGNVKYLFNDSLDACLAMAITNEPDRYSILVIDVVSNKKFVSLGTQKRDGGGWSTLDGKRFTTRKKSSTVLDYWSTKENKMIREGSCDDIAAQDAMERKALTMVEEYGFQII